MYQYDSAGAEFLRDLLIYTPGSNNCHARPIPAFRVLPRVRTGRGVKPREDESDELFIASRTNREDKESRRTNAWMREGGRAIKAREEMEIARGGCVCEAFEHVAMWQLLGSVCGRKKKQQPEDVERYRERCNCFLPDNDGV